MGRGSFSLQRIGIALGMLACVAAAPPRTGAHGLHGHIHVTGWAIENLPPGELKEIFDDPDVFKAALAGAMFPDTGYAISVPAAREYAEYSHWEPFIERFIQHVLITYGPTYDTKEEKLLVAFLLGCASHGLQDELFDSTFLFEIEQRDGGGQDASDPGTDGFLVLDGYFRLLPSDYLPIDEVLPLYGVLNQPIDRVLIEDHVRAVRGAYVNDFLGIRIAATNGMRLRPQIPWAGENYLDPGISGSLAAEIQPTARHMEALWERLHGRFDEANLVVHAWPDPPRRLRSANHQDVASWVTLVLGKGVEDGSATASLADGDGAAHPFYLRYTRWGGTSRLVRFQAAADFVPGAEYVATLEAGTELVDGSITTQAHSHTFRVECTTAEDPLCPPVVVTDDPTIIVFSPTPTRTATPLPTSTPTVTPTRSNFKIDGCVVHFHGCGGSLEFGVVYIEPLGRSTGVEMGFFSFADVPPGDYTLRYSPACNPAGCTGRVQVKVVDEDGWAAFYRSTCPGDCSIDYSVTVDELLLCVNIAMGGPRNCPHCDINSDGQATIDELVTAVNAALNGCD